MANFQAVRLKLISQSRDGEGWDAELDIDDLPIGNRLTRAGTTVVDFGDSYTDFVSVSVSQPDMPAAAHVRGWLMGHTMSANDIQAHRLLSLFSKIVTYNVVESVGFTLDVFCYIGRARGRYRVDWSY